MNVCECPSEHLLRDYLGGRLDRGTHEAIDDHLDACTACTSTADGLEHVVHASFPCLNGPAPADARPTDASFRQLVDRAKALGAGLPPANGEAGPGEGTVLGNYVLMEPIGGGGMGRVFKARHRLMKRLVAVKVLSPDLFRSAGARARFRREVEAAARLTHPHIVAAYDAGEEAGRDFLVMEYVEGHNLSDMVKREGPLPVGRALDYITQAARGLAYAHAAGVVHRDVKPANLLVDASGALKVLDMGLARVPLSDEVGGDPSLTSTGVVMGTAAFMAPEQAADTRRADERSDIYSLGCCLYFLVAGRPPYDGQTPMDILFAHREQPIPSLSRAAPSCPAALDALFRSMVAKAREDRPASMAAVLAELDAAARLTPRVRRRRTAQWIVAACALAVAASLAAVVFLHPAGAPAPTTPPKADDPPAPVAVGVEPPAPNAIPPDPPPARPKQLSVETVLIKAGEFLRGSPESDRDALEDEKPQKRISISHPFFLAKTKVTQGLFQRVVGKNPSAFGSNGGFKEKVREKDTSEHPVESVRWIEAIEFCNRLSERDGLSPYYHIESGAVTVNGGDGWRLPTEAEWEYACRAGTDTRWSFGDDASELGDYAWFAGNSDGMTHPVAQKKPNPWGLFDMHGDVPEWCWDRYAPDYYKRSHLIDPAGDGRAESRSYRGGGWNDDAAQTRSASRQYLKTDYGGVLNHIGFRVARDAAP
jgi:serine/threonine protein kinase